MKTIAVIAPSSPSAYWSDRDKERIQAGFTRLGWFCRFGTHVADGDRFVAGTDTDRAADVMQAFCDPDIDAVITLRGGYGSNRLADKLDYDLLRKNQKPFFAFSDGTALQTALFSRAGITGWTGFQASFFLHDERACLVEPLRRALAGEPFAATGLTPWTQGTATGVLVGGTLSVLTGLVGTPYFPDMRGKLLLLEELHEYPYKIDRMLVQLRQSGILNQAAGIVLGDFSTCLSKDAADGTVADVLHEHLDDLNIPVVAGLPYGHYNGKTLVPTGITLTLDADKGALIQTHRR